MEVDANTLQVEGYEGPRMLHDAGERLGTGGCVIGARITRDQQGEWGMDYAVANGLVVFCEAWPVSDCWSSLAR